MAFHDRWQTGQLLSRATTDLSTIRRFFGFGAIFLAPRLRHLTDRHPGLTVELVATARIFSLSKREADIAISLSRPRQARVVSRRLTDYRLHVYAARDYLERAAYSMVNSLDED